MMIRKYGGWLLAGCMVVVFDALQAWQVAVTLKSMSLTTGAIACLHTTFTVELKHHEAHAKKDVHFEDATDLHCFFKIGCMSSYHCIWSDIFRYNVSINLPFNLSWQQSNTMNVIAVHNSSILHPPQ